MLSSHNEMQANNHLQQYASTVKGEEFAREYYQLMEALKELRANLPRQDHVSFDALNRLANESGHLAEIIYSQEPSYYSFYTSATPIEKVRALKDTLVHAKQVAQNPFSAETTQALYQSAIKMEDTTAGYETHVKIAAGIVGLALALAVITIIPLVALHIITQPDLTLRLGLCLLGLKCLWIAESISPVAKSTSDIRSQAYALNRNCHFNQNNRQVSAPEAQPEQQRQAQPQM